MALSSGRHRDRGGLFYPGPADIRPDVQIALKKEAGPIYVGKFAIAVAFAWAYSKLYSPRAAYIHFGAMLGEYHGGNVFL